MEVTLASIGRESILANKLIGDWQAGSGLRGILINMLDKAIGMEGDRIGREVIRRHIFGYLFADMLGLPAGKQVSSKSLSNEAWYSLYAWIQPTKDQETGQWRSENINFQREVMILVDEAKRAQAAWNRQEAEMLGQLGFL